VSDATPVQITTTIAHGYHSGMTVTVASSAVGAINGSWPITVTSATTFTLDGSTASGAGGPAGTVSGTILYQPMMAWTTGKTPVLDVHFQTRYLVYDGSTFKGAITTALPTTYTPSVRDVGGLGMVYQIQFAAPMYTNTVNWLTVVDTASSQAAVQDVIALTSSGLDVARIGNTRVAGFLTGTLPVTYSLPLSGVNVAVSHLLAGFTPNTSYRVTSDITGQVTIKTGGTGLVVTSSDDGVLQFTLDSGTGATLVATVSQGAILRYMAANNDACSITASTTPTLLSPIDDLNPDIYPGADQDGGGHLLRTVVLGSRSPLTPETLYYFRATCGTSTLSFSFQTPATPTVRAVALPIQTSPPQRFGTVKLLVEYGPSATLLDSSVVISCPSGNCNGTLPTTNDRILFVRRSLLDINGNVLSVGRAEPIVIP
jgi:hypothetical protein